MSTQKSKKLKFSSSDPSLGFSTLTSTNPNGEVSDEAKRMKVMIHNFSDTLSGQLKTEIDLEKYGKDIGESVTNILVQELCSVHPKITSLNLNNCTEITDVALIAIATHCTELKILSLQNCSKITTVGLRAISFKCKNIIELDLNNCSNIDDASLTVAAGGSWRIKKLSLNNCQSITDNGVSRIAQGLGSCLEYLSLDGCPCIGEFGDRGLKEIGLYCKNLRELSISQARRIEDNGLIALATGCLQLTVLSLSGCENISVKSFKKCIQNLTNLTSLQLNSNKGLYDNDFRHLINSAWSEKLHTLNLINFVNLTDNGVGIITQALGNTLLNFNVSKCNNLTDYSCILIGNHNPNLRSLDLSYCGNFTSSSIKSISMKLNYFTQLKVDGNPRISKYSLIEEIKNGNFEFVELASQWFGYEPKPFVEKLIEKKVFEKNLTKKVIKIQCLVRRRFANQIYEMKYRDKVIEKSVLIIQATVRGYFQKKRYRLIQKQLFIIREIIKIQTYFRRYRARKAKIAELKRRKYQKFRETFALTLQKLYRGYKGREKVLKLREKRAMKLQLAAQRRAIEEIKANVIQKYYRGYIGRKIATQLYLEKIKKDHEEILRNYSVRLIQRVIRGWLGRVKAKKRLNEILFHAHKWRLALHIQRIFRGYLGRKIFYSMIKDEILRRKNYAAVLIQKTFRGYRGRLLGSVAMALKKLRNYQQIFAVKIQKFVRGCFGRIYAKKIKAVLTKKIKETKAAIQIQRIYRGAKGREMREIEEKLKALDHKIKPLTKYLNDLEEKKIELIKSISRTEAMEQIMFNNLKEIEMELDYCMKTSNKYTDSNKINQTSQRYLTKFLRIRLKDHFENEKKNYNEKFLLLQQLRIDLRNTETQILYTQRELIPLTTGYVSEIKANRIERLREMVRLRRKAAILIQSVWRTAIILKLKKVYGYEGWLERYDREISDLPYYYNYITKETLKKKPLVFNYFGSYDTDYN